jgi:hypothetical protein
VVGTIEWYPTKKTWTGLFIDVGRGDWPVGPVLAARRGGTVYAAWTESLIAFDATPVTLAVRRSVASSSFVLDRALTTALALPGSGPEIAANEWANASDLGLGNEDRIWAATIVARSTRTELDGWIAGFAAPASGGRQLLLAGRTGLSWFRAPRALTLRMSIQAAAQPDGSVRISGQVPGVGNGKVTLYRERTGSSRTAVGRASISGGTFSLLDRPPARPLFYRAVYTDPKTGIPYAALLRQPVR